MISLIALGLASATALYSPLSSTAIATQISFSEDDVSSSYVQQAQKDVNNVATLNYDSDSFESDLLDEILPFEEENGLIDSTEMPYLRQYVSNKYSGNSLSDGNEVTRSYSTSLCASALATSTPLLLDDSSLTSAVSSASANSSISNLPSYYAGFDGGGSSSTSTNPTALTEAQVKAKYGESTVDINGKVNGNIFFGIQANTAACVGLYNSMILNFEQNAAIIVSGGTTAFGILLKVVKTMELCPFIAAEMAKISKYVSDLVLAFSNTVVGAIIAFIIGIIVIAIAAVLVAMFFCGAHGHGFRFGIVRYGFLNYGGVCEEYL